MSFFDDWKEPAWTTEEVIQTGQFLAKRMSGAGEDYFTGNISWVFDSIMAFAMSCGPEDVAVEITMATVLALHPHMKCAGNA